MERDLFPVFARESLLFGDNTRPHRHVNPRSAGVSDLKQLKTLRFIDGIRA
jgi:hypothetical protein